MSDKRDKIPSSAERFSLRRWSQRKLAADQAPAAPAATPSAPPAAAAPSVASEAPAAANQVLPPVESLTFESDFKLFLRPEVDESLRRAALKQLFRDPRFNIMDGLDTYIDDYSRADPIPADMLKQLVQARYIFNPPKTEINADGHVIDSPVDDVAEVSKTEDSPTAAPNPEDRGDTDASGEKVP